MINITDVRMKLVENGSKLKATFCITIDDCFVVHDIKLIKTNDDKYLLSFPSRCVNDVYMDVAHPIRTEARELLQKIAVQKYESMLESVD